MLSDNAEMGIPLLTCKGSQVQVLVRPPKKFPKYKITFSIRREVTPMWRGSLRANLRANRRIHVVTFHAPHPSGKMMTPSEALGREALRR
jgi:hypothetical protein